MNYNKLTPSETERLAILMEECGEIVQICGKILRHGYESYNPFDSIKTSNRKLLEKEIGDIVWITKFMAINNDINTTNIIYAEEQKAINIKQYLHHQEDK